MELVQEIKVRLFQLQDLSYKKFQAPLIPSVDQESIIGVRTPLLRKLAKELSGKRDINDFLHDLPHQYFEENQLHAFIVASIKDFETCLNELEHFLPYVDNWATTDQMSPLVFKKNKDKLISPIKTWIASKRTYSIRFGIGMLMKHFLDEDFNPHYLQLVANIKSDEYYVNMMRAWYFATALAKQNESTLPYLNDNQLDEWTHNQTIQKAIESRRIMKEQKAYLRTLKITHRR